MHTLKVNPEIPNKILTVKFSQFCGDDRWVNKCSNCPKCASNWLEGLVSWLVMKIWCLQLYVKPKLVLNYYNLSLRFDLDFISFLFHFWVIFLFKKTSLLAYRVVSCSHQSDRCIRVCISHQSNCHIGVCITHHSYHSIWTSCTDHSVWVTFFSCK